MTSRPAFPTDVADTAPSAGRDRVDRDASLASSGPEPPLASSGPEPPSQPAMPYEERLGRLRASLTEANLRALLVGHLPDVRYLCGFSGSNGLLLVHEGAALLITDFRYEEQAADEVPASIDLRVTREGLLVELAVWLEERPLPGPIGFQPEHLSVRDRRELGERCAGTVWEAAPRLVGPLRAIKDPGEVTLIRRAARIGDDALAHTLDCVAPGMSEKELAAELEYRLRREGSDGPAFESVVAAGHNTSRPHARPSGRLLQEGDLVLFDFGAVVDGYCSDMTRTFTLGPAEPWQRAAHVAVRRALEAALSRVGPDRPAREVDAAARTSLEADGLGSEFRHSTGHGLGLEVHESPRLHRDSEEVLTEGNVVTIEPGIYLPGRGGVRIEEDAVVTARGAELLTGFSRDLLEL